MATDDDGWPLKTNDVSEGGGGGRGVEIRLISFG